MPVVISDTSPLRALAHLDGLDLLKTLFTEVLVPPAVVAELEQPRARFAPLMIQSLPFVRIMEPGDRSVVDGLLDFLGPGEAEAIALAIETKAEAILIDEAAGRAEARQRGLRPLGVLGILLRAKQRHLIERVAPLLDRLQGELGFFISPSLREEICRRAGE